jgi:hypothetical protein
MLLATDNVFSATVNAAERTAKRTSRLVCNYCHPLTHILNYRNGSLHGHIISSYEFLYIRVQRDIFSPSATQSSPPAVTQHTFLLNTLPPNKTFPAGFQKDFHDSKFKMLAQKLSWLTRHTVKFLSCQSRDFQLFIIHHFSHTDIAQYGKTDFHVNRILCVFVSHTGWFKNVHTFHIFTMTFNVWAVRKNSQSL